MATSLRTGSYSWEISEEEINVEELRSNLQRNEDRLALDELIVLKLCVEQTGYENHERLIPKYVMKKEGRFEVSYVQLLYPEPEPEGLPILATIFFAMDIPLDECRDVYEDIFFALLSLIGRRARRELTPTPTPTPTLPLLHVKLRVKSSLWYDDLHVRMFRQRQYWYYNNPNRPGMVPASRSAVEGLEEVTLADQCAICLEDFPSGATVTRIHCSHVFHAHCVVRWLNTSRYCPICGSQIHATQ